MTKLFSRRLSFILVLAIVLTVTVGGVYTAEMMTMEDGMMHNCPFMGVPALCEMSPLAHLTEWQQMFTTTVQQVVTFALLLLIAAALAWHFVRLPLVPKRIEIPLPRHRNASERILNPLKLAFSRGIIHPKVF